MQINKKEKINHANTDYSKYHMADMTDYSIYWLRGFWKERRQQ